VQVVEVERAVLVVDPRTDVLVGLPEPEGAPCGSATKAMRPESKMSNGSTSTLPPAALTFSAVSSALSTWMYVFHSAGCASSPICELTAAASRPRIRAM
jgi:hypothetical protein